MASDMETGSSYFTSSPQPASSLTMSRLPPMSVAMTGRPAAMASMMRKERASCSEELTYRSLP